MNALEVVCPECLSAPGAQCTFKVRDGNQNQKHPHEKRIAVAHLASEPTFTLRAQDISACQLVQLWITLNHKAPKEKLESAERTLEAMREWPIKKVAD